MNGAENLVISGGRNNALFRKTVLDCALKQHQALGLHVVVDQLALKGGDGFQNGQQMVGLLRQEHHVRAQTLSHDRFGHLPDADQAQELIDQADVLLVGGGSTRILKQRWEALGIAERIKERVQTGKMVGSGASAGALIWFEEGHSDSWQYEVKDGERWQYSKIPGLGVLHGIATVHYEATDNLSRQRSESFRDLLHYERGSWQSAIALETNAALICANGIATVRSLRPEHGNAYTFIPATRDLPYRRPDGATIALP